MSKFKKGARRLLSVWYLFVGWALAAVIALMLIFGFKTAYKPNEQITMFVAANEVKSDVLNEELKRIKPNYLARIKLDYCDVPDNETIYNVNWMQATALGTDIYVLPESKLDSEACNAYFMPLTQEFLNVNFAGQDTYSVEDTVYGLKLHDAASNIGGMKDFLSFAEEDYYLCFGRHCLHLGSTFNHIYDGAVKIAQKLLSTEGF